MAGIGAARKAERAGGDALAMALGVALGLALASSAFWPGNALGQGRAAGGDPAASQILGERPEPPRRETRRDADGAAQQGQAPGLRARLDAPRDAREGWGPLGWFGAAAIVASLGLLAAGLSGAFGRAAARVMATGGVPAAVASGGDRRLIERNRPTQASRPPSAALPKGPHRKDAVTLMALHDELSPRRRRAAAFAYGARDLPPSPGPAPATPCAAPAPPPESKVCEAIEKPKPAQPAQQPQALAHVGPEEAALADLAERSANLARLIRDFSRTKAARRDRDGRGGARR